ncbi:MAG TPA: hypothetical protein VIY49_37880 [Bryobacteraceae bacterium]
MTDDQKAIQSAYADALGKLYAALFEKYEEAGGDTAQEQQADQQFTTGLGLARRSRDRALALVA